MVCLDHVLPRSVQEDEGEQRSNEDAHSDPDDDLERWSVGDLDVLRQAGG